MALTDRRWLDYAGYASARLRRDCPVDRLAALIAVERLLMRSALEIGDGVAVMVEVVDVRADGTDGEVVTVLTTDGTQQASTRTSERWAYEADAWWLDEPSWGQACT